MMIARAYGEGKYHAVNEVSLVAFCGYGNRNLPRWRDVIDKPYTNDRIPADMCAKCVKELDGKTMS